MTHGSESTTARARLSTETRVTAMAENRTAALAAFAEWFAQNYPGPRTVIHDPNWHAPKIFRAVENAMRAESPASASPNIAESNDRADAALASMDSEDAARFRWLCGDHDDRVVRHLRDSLIERMSVMSLSAVRAAIDIHLKNPSEPSHKPGTCSQCGRYLDRRGRCRFPEHNA